MAWGLLLAQWRKKLCQTKKQKGLQRLGKVAMLQRELE